MAGMAWNPAVPFSSDAPNAVVPTVANKCQYDYPVMIEQPEVVDCTYGVGMISEWDQATQRHKIVVPDADSIDSSRCVVLPGHKCTPSGGQPDLITGSLYPLRPIIARYDKDDGEPDFGDTLGTKADSWKLKKGGTGFTFLGMVDATEGLCLVRPFASGGKITVTGDFSCRYDFTTGGTYKAVSTEEEFTSRGIFIVTNNGSTFSSDVNVTNPSVPNITLNAGIEVLDESMNVIAFCLGASWASTNSLDITFIPGILDTVSPIADPKYIRTYAYAVSTQGPGTVQITDCTALVLVKY